MRSRLFSKRRILIAAFVAAVVAAPLGLSTAIRSAGSTPQASAASSGATAAAPAGPTVTSPVAFGNSIPVRNMSTSVPASKLPPAYRLGEAEALIHPTGNSTFFADPVVQGSGGSAPIPPTSSNFDGNNIGESSSDGVFVGAPSDTNGDVGPNHYVQIVNSVFSVYSKTGTRLTGPTPIDDLWATAPNAAEFDCTTQSRGDPIVQYDPLADRWLISQFNFPGVAVIAPPFDECVAISQSPDPTGAYYLYDFHFSDTIFNDYPHIGVWPDGYYISYNQFDTTTPNTDFHSAAACVFERPKMLVGDPNAQQVCFDESAFDPKDANGNYIYGGQQPTDLDGAGYGASFRGAPPAGEPNFFMQFLDSTTAGQDKLLKFNFHVDWANPANSTFGNGASHLPTEIPVADFSVPCNGDQTLEDRNCIPQVDVDPTHDYGDATGSDIGGYLDSIGDRLMYRVAYRNFGDHESLVLNHSVNAGPGDTFVGNGHVGIRWYELRNPSGTPTVYQQSTYAPDPAHRWMGSIAQDSAGDIALGYSKSSGTTHPSINYAARQVSDPLSTMGFAEGTIINGTGSQQGTGSRWGDYSSLNVDPNGCTFWYTTEYYTGNGRFGWSTRVGSFALPKCGDPQLSLNASASRVRINSDITYTIGVTSGQNPVQGASVTDVVPAGLTLLSVTTSKGSCTGVATVVCNLGDLPAGDLETITVKVQAGSGGTFTDNATLTTTSADPDTSNNSASAKTVVDNPCTVPGVTLITDPTGDETNQLPAYDVQRISVAEPATQTDKLVFTLKMASLATVPPNTTWPVTFFYGKDATGAPQQWFVAMQTSPLGAVSFTYGLGDASDPGIGSLDTGSGFAPDGTITLVVAHSKIAPAQGGTLAPGKQLTGFLTRIRLETGTGGALTPDNAPDSVAPTGEYVVSGNAFCSNRAPIAALMATPTNGSTPLTVSFNGSGSSDPDGDAITAYNFRFGDGSTPVSQASPTTSHTYTTPGTYHVTLTVTDSRGLESANSATVDVVATAQPAADMQIVKTGPATGKVGQTLTYIITAKNNGPQTANGVTVIDTLAKNAGFGSVKTTQGSCGPKPQQQVVTCNVGSMQAGATVTVTLVIKPTAKGAFTDTAKVSSTSPNDPVSSNNTSSVTTSVS